MPIRPHPAAAFRFDRCPRTDAVLFPDLQAPIRDAPDLVWWYRLAASYTRTVKSQRCAASGRCLWRQLPTLGIGEANTGSVWLRV